MLWAWPLLAFSGEIRGKVLNAQGAAVAGATVSISSSNGQESKATTAADGTYTIPNVQAGEYIVTLTAAPGPVTLRRNVAIREADELVRADFQLPQTAAESSPAVAAEERNPNIFIYRIDLNDLRNRLNVGRGPDPQYTPEFMAEQNYYGVEFGAPLFRFEPLRSRNLAREWRGSVFYLHQNSALNARNFFNVGPLRASRVNSYDLSAGGPLPSRKASLLLGFGQTYTSGMVNGNIQVPDPEFLRLTPRSPDPRVNALITNLLNAFPGELPNLRLPNGHVQLNSNAPRSIKSTDGLARLDYRPYSDSLFAFRYSMNDYTEDPFQLVAGQNPQTDLRSQGAYASLTKTFSHVTLGRFGFHYDRATAILDPTRRFSNLFSSLGIANVPDVEFTSQSLTGIGPGLQFPRHRVQNRYQTYSDISHTAGRHNFKAGWSSTRVQVNDLQSDNSRGFLSFAQDFGRSDIENFLLGTPSRFTITLGNLYRGFRNWEHALFISDQFRVTPTLSLSAGLRYELFTNPQEVNDLTEVGLPTDKNNVAPRFGLAWNPMRGKTTVRASYGMSYSMLFPVSYGMTRFNPPATQTIIVPAPNILDPLGGSSGGAKRPATFRLSPDLVMPYSHQYTFGIERALPGASTVRAAYIGMRSIHELTLQHYNRARPVPGIPARTETIDQRRPDQRYSTTSFIESNNISYYDAFQLNWDKRMSRGLTFRASYTFSKNLDTGGDFTNTASGVDKPPESGEATSEISDRVADMKGPSLFDTPHVLILSYSYMLPSLKNGAWASSLLKGWQISGTTIFQSGTPFHLHTGSDGPGTGNVDGTSHDRPNIINPALLHKSLDDPNTTFITLGANTCFRDSQGSLNPGTAYLNCPGYFDTNLPPSGRGNLGMNTFRKDGTANWNFALGRTFRLPGGRERTLLFRSEFINLFNTPQFEKPGVQMASPIFGQITNTANKGRQVQFSLRLNF